MVELPKQPSSDLVARRGWIEVSAGLADENPETLVAFFEGAVVLEVDTGWMTDDYLVCHPAFAALDADDSPPVYGGIATRHDDGSVTVEWTRKGDR